jgi:polyisoprenoid-binding protein YceI
MKRIIFLLLLIFLFFIASAQKYMTKNGYIGFFSHTPVEDIKADNNQVASVLDLATGDIVFQVLIKSFKFENALMEEHFNENYLESEKFPKSTFKGKITSLNAVDLSKKGTYDVTVEGELSIHGVSKPLTAKGSVEVADAGITANSKFILVPEDYNVKIPSVVRNNIAKTIEVTTVIKYTPVESGK